VPEAPLPEVPPEQALELREQRIEAIRHWICTGRVGATNGKGSLSASMRWVQDRDGYQIRLSGPLGQGLVDVIGSGSGVSLRTGDRGTFFAPSPEVLLDEQFGWRLPVSGLRYWILGLPVPDAEVSSRELDVYGRITRLEQSGWRIDYLDYILVDGVDLPSRLELLHPELSARIAVRRWQLQS
jgi:outer membrane lipoprotein LolB